MAFIKIGGEGILLNIFLIRHGRQNSALCNVDVELSREGIAQAELLRDRICHYRIDALYSSNFIRAVQTADILNQKLKLPHIIREELREISFGRLEGKTEEYIKEYFTDFTKENFSFIDDIPYPDGENGTSVYERAMPVIQDIVQSGKQNIAIVTHGGLIRVLLAALFGKSQARRILFGISLENTSITQLVYNPENDRFYLERFNDFAHIEGHPELLRSNI